MTTCLMSGAPMLAWCGPELSLIYNDAAIPLLGAAHPTALGRTVPDSDERWSMIRTALSVTVSERQPQKVAGMSLSPVFDADGLVAVVGTPLASDSNIQDSGTDLRATIRAEEAKKAKRAKDDFLGMVGHELRDPLSNVSTILHALMLRGSTRELELMERSLRQLSRLVDDMLETSRLSRTTSMPTTTIVELADLVDRAVALVTPLVEGSRIRIDVPRTNLRVAADRDRLVRAFANALLNAAQHTPPGHAIRVVAMRQSERVRLSIADAGELVPAEPTGDVTFHEDRRPGSLGLGLAVARSIVELHGGTFMLTSHGTDRGAECVFDLPATDDTATVTTQPVSATPRRLLLVEDNDDAARAMKVALELLGYEVALAHNAPIALNLAKTFRPDVALLDLGLPIMDGWELAKRLRDTSATLPIVAVTARDEDTDKQRSTDAGIAEHLVKPIDLPMLKRIVDQLSASPASGS